MTNSSAALVLTPLLFFSAALPAAAPPASTGAVKPAPAKHYAVTLVNSFTPVSPAKAARDFPRYTAYTTKANVFGQELYLVRIGFFPSLTAANAAKEKALAAYPGAWATAVTENEYRTALRLARREPPKAEPVPPPKPAEPKAPPARAGGYAINLESSGAPDVKPSKPVPPALRNLPLYRTSFVRDGKRIYVVRLGLFATEQEAERTRRKLAASFPKAAVVRVSAREREEALRVTGRGAETPAVPELPPVAAPAAPSPVVPAAALTQTDRQAEPLLAQGREALTRGDDRAAVQVLSRLLKLPPSKSSQEAQEFIGLAHERLRETGRARIEYELYLKLYPEGEGAERVRQRLAHLSTAPPPAKLKEVKKEETQRLIFGSLSQYYYQGKSQVETTPYDRITANPLDKTALTLTDQKSLVTNFDFNARYRGPDTDTRWVFRDTLNQNFLPGADDKNRITAAYYDYKHKPSDLSARLGRQSGSSGGVLGRFDGLLAGYGLTPKWRVNAVGGIPVESPAADSKVKFSGFGTDLGTFAEHWNGGLYVIKQEADGIIDRQATGAELRYFDPRLTFYSLVDYDTYFGDHNTALLQGSWTTAGNTIYNFMLDHRMSPPLLTTTALQSVTTTSMKTLLETLSEEEIKRRAQALTARVDTLFFGVTVPVSAKWQLGVDARRVDISATEGAGVMPATPPTHNQMTYTAQVIGTGLFSTRDVSVLSASHTADETFDGQSYAITNRTPLGDRWNFELALRYYTQETNLNVETTRVTPTLKIGYKWKDNLALEFEGGVEKTSTFNPATVQEDTKRQFWSLGYRWDF